MLILFSKKYFSGGTNKNKATFANAQNRFCKNLKLSDNPFSHLSTNKTAAAIVSKKVVKFLPKHLIGQTGPAKRQLVN